MRIEYDPAYNIAYIRLIEEAAKDLQTVGVSDELNIDMTADGRIYGIELLNANERLFGQKPGELVTKTGKPDARKRFHCPEHSRGPTGTLFPKRMSCALRIKDAARLLDTREQRAPPCAAA